MHYLKPTLLLLALSLTGCPSPGTVPPAFAPGPCAALVHRDSGFSFPPRLGHFVRVLPTQYDSGGRDVSVGYNHNQSPHIAATIYVYPAQYLSLQEEFGRRQNEITSQHPGAKLISSGSANVTPRNVPALSAEYLYTGPFAGSNQPLHSQLLVARDNNRFVEYRFTYPAGATATAQPLTQNLAQTFPWP